MSYLMRKVPEEWTLKIFGLIYSRYLPNLYLWKHKHVTQNENLTYASYNSWRLTCSVCFHRKMLLGVDKKIDRHIQIRLLHNLNLGKCYIGNVNYQRRLSALVRVSESVVIVIKLVSTTLVQGIPTPKYRGEGNVVPLPCYTFACIFIVHVPRWYIWVG